MIGIGAAVNSSAFIAFVVRETKYYAALLRKPIIPEVKGSTVLGSCVHYKKKVLLQGNCQGKS